MPFYFRKECPLNSGYLTLAVTAAKSVMAFRVLTMAVDLCRLTTRTMNVNAGHERTSKARIIHQIQLIRGITRSCRC
ncbi:Transposase [Shigella dysenteriae 1617]|uniref:Transposase n=2 Tax=Shigella dysenteriae 1617 TaxID=754093 RepID=A0A0A6ZRV0_SHIDY|nr:Transposase [Shigella dysenteriae 1617]